MPDEIYVITQNFNDSKSGLTMQNIMDDDGFFTDRLAAEECARKHNVNDRVRFGDENEYWYSVVPLSHNVFW